MLKNAAVGGSLGMLANVLLQPFDMVKTRCANARTHARRRSHTGTPSRAAAAWILAAAISLTAR